MCIVVDSGRQGLAHTCFDLIWSTRPLDHRLLFLSHPRASRSSIQVIGENAICWAYYLETR